ncbi:MAG: GIY-YIG nuclease family protein [bacterium]|nr:GIY-YIG nuclease family protein [bacterium]
MYSVYVIQSQIDNRLYVGMSRDIKKRLDEHNNGKVFSTKGYRPWAFVYSEFIGNRVEARKREKYLKGGSGKEFIKKIIPG